ncbi:ankyrin repeat protein [Rhodopirellula maiorica SM1]|uniref:Ankyrin repeat protein n=1 Tax=Rhodopirellula maiorica SM1 TaxID=1265738 RepID=M5RR04_9BACT|nr:ankyrin repeat domain-containing protein [Rhodopirellula maiorica]EMI16384.1 ankyrin repeat protein [Rhodopirellula maiorica SM1]
MNPPRNDELVQAAVAGDFETVKRLIEAGADPNSVDQHGMGPLLNFDPAVTRYLLEHGADPDRQRNENISPVLGASGNVECMRLMLEAGANVNRASEHNGETALHGYAGSSDVNAVQMLLDYGADPNARTKPGMKTYCLWRDARVRGETPLHRAAAWGSSEVIRLLLDADADPTLRDVNKDTPLSWASWYRRDKSIIDQLWYEGSGVGPDFPPDEAATLQ